MCELVDDLKKYVAFSNYIDGNDSNVQEKAMELKSISNDETELVKNTYLYVRDDIKHSWDIQDKRVTVTASDVLREKVGICWAKANLLVALLRVNGIPAGICYQRLTLGDTPEEGYCIHALNAVYIESLDKWIRLDARGNKLGVDAQFSLEEEKLAFPIREEFGEIDYREIYAAMNPWNWNGIDGLLGSFLGTGMLIPFVIAMAVMLVGLFICFKEAYGNGK